METFFVCSGFIFKFVLFCGEIARAEEGSEVTGNEWDWCARF